MVTEAGRQACLVSPAPRSCSAKVHEGRGGGTWFLTSPVLTSSLSGTSGNRLPGVIREGLVCTHGELVTAWAPSPPSTPLCEWHRPFLVLSNKGPHPHLFPAACLTLSLRWAQPTRANGIQVVLHTHPSRSGGDRSLTQPGRAWVAVLKPVLSGEKKENLDC